MNPQNTPAQSVMLWKVTAEVEVPIDYLGTVIDPKEICDAIRRAMPEGITVPKIAMSQVIK